jgi:hypothetical protein
MLQPVVFDVKRETAKKTAFRDDHARYPGRSPKLIGPIVNLR